MCAAATAFSSTSSAPPSSIRRRRRSPDRRAAQGQIDDPYAVAEPCRSRRRVSCPATSAAGRHRFPGVACHSSRARDVYHGSVPGRPYTQSMNLTDRASVGPRRPVGSYAGKLSQKLEGPSPLEPGGVQERSPSGQAPSAQNVNNRVSEPQTIGLLNTQSRSRQRLPLRLSQRAIPRRKAIQPRPLVPGLLRSLEGRR